MPSWVKVFGDSYLTSQDAKYRAMDELELADYNRLIRNLAEAGSMQSIVLTSAGVMPMAWPIGRIQKEGEFFRPMGRT